MTTRKPSGRRLKSGPGISRSSDDYQIHVRAQVFEVIVRSALGGVNWQELCAGPMQVNNITAQEIIDEVNRRSPPTPPAAAAGIPRAPVFKDFTRNRREQRVSD